MFKDVFYQFHSPTRPQIAFQIVMWQYPFHWACHYQIFPYMLLFHRSLLFYPLLASCCAHSFLRIVVLTCNSIFRIHVFSHLRNRPNKCPRDLCIGLRNYLVCTFALKLSFCIELACIYMIRGFFTPFHCTFDFFSILIEPFKLIVFIGSSFFSFSMELIVLEPTSVLKVFGNKFTIRLAIGCVVSHLSSIKRAIIHDIEARALRNTTHKNTNKEGTIGFVHFTKIVGSSSLAK